MGDAKPIERHAMPMLRRWCPIAETHQDADDVWCGWDHDSERHRLRKRRMLVCSVCQQGYFNQQEFDEHECWSAY